ncbi:hypothetical protein DSM03_1011228 [Leeuwenhoekiella aestuarii]|uniref:Uncharacterized protein n=1 Tax=Leeuwenhoekiella aestuarii TaxID=2249426 RepID=A0A4Q0P066_9FLAO|nr:hypothetical protein [Leeuwenhoekiella aestuarii]RXG18537.1 hypothetical protein DSM04_101739 [Leeuwenhoekiella aestuarii]RXG19842.1 hypothetical protein DSM03_1011228 [Leeuwenhoekiella aestuarii]
MDKSFVLDLGQNSIGWVIIDNNTVEEIGVCLFPSKKIITNNIESSATKLSTFINKNIRLISLIILTVILFMMGVLITKFWQFWINLAIAGIYSVLTVEIKK